MEAKTEKKSIKNKVENKMQKKSEQERGGAAKRALICKAWRNVGPGGEDFRRGIRSNPGQKEQDRERKTEEKSSTPCPASWGGGSLRAFRRAGLLRDDWYHFLLVQLSIHCGSQSPRSIPRSRPKIPKKRPKMGPDGTKMGPKPSEKAPGGAPKAKKATKEARWDKRHSNLNVPEPLGPYF